MRRHVLLRSTRSVFEHSQPAAPNAHISRLTFAFLTFKIRSQESCDVHTTSKKSNACEKKKPQGIIVDFLKKQAQQSPSSKGSGFRPLDAPLSRNTRKPEDSLKSSTLHDSFPTVLDNRHHRDYITETADSTRQPHNVSCDANSLSTSRRAIHTKAALPVPSSNTRTNPRLSVSGDCITQSSGASRSDSLFQSAQDLSTRASVGKSLLGPCIVNEVSEHNSGMLFRPVVPPQPQALPTSGPPYRRPDVSNSLINQTSTSVHDDSIPFRTCLPLEFQTQVSTQFVQPQAPTHMHAQEPSVIGSTSAHHGFVDKQNAFPTNYPQGAQTKL